MTPRVSRRTLALLAAAALCSPPFAATRAAAQGPAAQSPAAVPAPAAPTAMGDLVASPNSPAGRALAAGADREFIAGIYALRDMVYESAPSTAVEAAAVRLEAAAPSQPLGELDRHLVAARIDYLVARSYNESGDKKRAVPRFEAAIAAAREALKPGESPAALQALMKPLSELCLLKDMGFLVANGPKISQYAKKILALEPGHVGALVTIASSKAYPPPVFGGNPKEAIAEMTSLLASHKGGFEKDELFDLRMCLATAAAKLGRADEARLWYDAALKLYPHNKYALEQRGKLNK